MVHTQSQQLSIFIDMFLAHQKTLGKNPQKLFYEGWYYISDGQGFILSYNGNIVYPSLEEYENNEFADTFLWAVEEKEEQKTDEQEKPKATTLPTRTFEGHLECKSTQIGNTLSLRIQ
jgi:hypothetical protein